MDRSPTPLEGGVERQTPLEVARTSARQRPQGRSSAGGARRFLGDSVGGGVPLARPTIAGATKRDSGAHGAEVADADAVGTVGRSSADFTFHDRAAAAVPSGAGRSDGAYTPGFEGTG